MHLKKLTLALCLSTVMLCPAMAAENGNSQFSPGAAQFFAGAFPPYPGLYFLSQTNIYSSNRLNDGNGNKIPINFNVTSVAEALRFLYVTPVELGGGKVFTQLVVPLVSVNLTTPAGKSNSFALADMVGTIGVSWNLDRKNAIVLGMDIAAPTGAYDTRNAASPGLNHWSFQPVVGYHYSDPEGLEAGITSRLVFNTRNNATGYTNGSEWAVDYAIGWNFDKLRVGAVGYYYQQFTNDTGPGAPADGHRGRGFAIGPALSYAFSQKLQVSASWQHDFIAENRAQGDAVWINFATSF